MNCKIEQDEIKKKIEREILLKKIVNIPDGQLLSFEDQKVQREFISFLERLIFFKVGNHKFPVWTGPFLKKIDLSQIDFSNVCFDITKFEMILQESSINLEDFKRYYGYLYPDEIKNNSLINSSVEHQLLEDDEFDADEEFEKIKRTSFNGYIDFSGTNIKVDFSKLAIQSVYNANFSNVDLSCSNVYCLKCDLCNFENCNLYVIPYQTETSNFKNNPLSDFIIDERYTKYKKNSLPEGCRYTDLECVFTNTGIQIMLKNNLPFSKKEYNYIESFFEKYNKIIDLIKNDTLGLILGDRSEFFLDEYSKQVRNDFDSFRFEFQKLLGIPPFKSKTKQNTIALNAHDDYLQNYKCYNGRLSKNMQILLEFLRIINSYNSIQNYIESGCLDGCYVNGYLVENGKLTDKPYEKKDNDLVATIVEKELVEKLSFFKNDLFMTQSSSSSEEVEEPKEDTKQNVMKRRRKF